MDFATLNKQRKFILIAAVVGIISIFLPWISFMGFSINGFHSYGIVVFLGFITATIIAIMGDQTTTLDKGMWLAVLIAGAVSLLFTIIFISDLSSVAGVGSALGGGFGTGFGIGLWIALLASIGIAGSAWMLKSPGDSLQGGFDSLKTKVTSTSNSDPAGSGGAAGPGKVNELERLIKLREEGKITEEEYQALKSKII